MMEIEEFRHEYYQDQQKDHSLKNLITHYKNSPGIEEAIEDACDKCKFVVNGRNHHVRHLDRRSGELIIARERLLKSIIEIQSCKSFEEVYDCVHDKIFNIMGINKLTVYDISLCLGAFLQFYPEKIYLSQGALRGAYQLGLVKTKTRPAIITYEEVIAKYPYLVEFKAYELEHIFCVYRDKFKPPFEQFQQ